MTDVALAATMRDFVFFSMHWLVHRKFIYRYVHKVHHRFPAPVALGATFSHPLDFYLQNVLPISLPMRILGSHVITLWVFASYSLLDAAFAHSGYSLWRMPSVTEHDVHHMTGSGNYGVYGIADTIFGTRTKM